MPRRGNTSRISRRRVALFIAAALVATAGSWVLVSSIGAARRIREDAHRSRAAGLQWPHLTAAQQQILLRVEDPGFFSHHGIDFGTPGAGMTTITQGLAKIYCFERWRPGVLRKVRQSLCALVIDASVGKEQQLAVFLNESYFGTDGEMSIRGFPAAARAHFGKAFGELERGDYVRLVAMLIGPNEHHPRRNPQKLAERTRRIEKVLKGECAPSGWRDAHYEGCR
ncbi:MAG TPA: transglycosylase domain-containing protein [Thermoanaerobaculia bacterium]|nr:transglycosylase domain-containing protein [Thermoanaerobaculia bacterium]